MYLDIGLTEFTSKFGSNDEEQNNNLNKYIRGFIKSNFNDIKINSVKIMVGSLVIATITLQGIEVFSKEMVSSTKPDFNMTYAYFGAGNTLIEILNNIGAE